MSEIAEKSTDIKEFKVTKGQRRYFFILLFLLYVFDYIDRNVVTSLFPQLKTEFGLSDAQCGLLLSVVTISVGLFTFPVSILIDRWSRKKTIGIMSIVWSIAAVSCAFTKSFKQLIALRSVVGIGEAGYVPGGLTMISAYYPPEKRATMTGLWNAALPIGVAVGIALGGVIATNLGWRYAFGLTAFPGLLVAILFFWVKDYKTAKIVTTTDASDKSNQEGKKKLGMVVKEFFRIPTLVFTYIGYIGATFCSFGIMAWMPTYYHRFEELAMDKAGPKAALLFLVAIVGAPLGGFITDKLRKKRLNAKLLVPAYTQLLNGFLTFVAFYFLTGNAQYVALLLNGVFAMMFIGGAATAIQDVIQPGLRATSYAVNSVLFFLFSATLSPVFVGAISDRYDLLTALKFLPIFPAVGGIAFLIGSSYYVRDMKKVENFILEESND